MGDHKLTLVGDESLELSGMTERIDDNILHGPSQCLSMVNNIRTSSQASGLQARSNETTFIPV